MFSHVILRQIRLDPYLDFRTPFICISKDNTALASLEI
jgi:hypothetical protein